MTSLATLQALSNDALLMIEKIKSKTFVLKKLSVYSKSRIARLDPDTEQH